MSQKGFYFDETKCYKCHSCQVACKMWNGVEIGPNWRRVVKVEEGKYPNVRKINVSLACMHCGKPACVAACPVKAISKRESDGIVLVDQSKCMGCGFCTWACPFNAPQRGNDGKMQKCTFCDDRPEGMPRACEEVCPNKAIISGYMEDLDEVAKKNAARKLFTREEPSLYIK